MKTLKTFVLAIIISSALMIFGSSTLAATNTAAATEINVVKFLPGFVWVAGHYKFDRFGFRVWVPAHWRKI